MLMLRVPMDPVPLLRVPLLRDKLLMPEPSVLTSTHAHAMTPLVQMITFAELPLTPARKILIARMKLKSATLPTVFVLHALVMSALPLLQLALNAQPLVTQLVFALLIPLARPPTQLLLNVPSTTTALLPSHAQPTAQQLLTAQTLKFAKL